jgi:hypothetical protein
MVKNFVFSLKKKEKKEHCQVTMARGIKRSKKQWKESLYMLCVYIRHISNESVCVHFGMRRGGESDRSGFSRKGTYSMHCYENESEWKNGPILLIFKKKEKKSDNTARKGILLLLLLLCDRHTFQQQQKKEIIGREMRCQVEY